MYFQVGFVICFALLMVVTIQLVSGIIYTKHCLNNTLVVGKNYNLSLFLSLLLYVYEG